MAAGTAGGDHPAFAVDSAGEKRRHGSSGEIEFRAPFVHRRKCGGQGRIYCATQFTDQLHFPAALPHSQERKHSFRAP
ncbi:hypothetical protein GCM10020255_015380 [Rhodococcus baikonurensis]